MKLLLRTSAFVIAIICNAGPVSSQGTSNTHMPDFQEATLRYYVSAAGVRASIWDIETNSERQIPLEVAENQHVAGTPSIVLMNGGVTSWQAWRALAQIPTLSGDIELPPEGSLAPGRYIIASEEMRWMLIKRMQARQRHILDEFWERRANDLPYSNRNDALITASLIERETSIPEERPLIASVLLNRLNQGMRLQLDTTVMYSITEGKENLNRRLRMSELRGDSPFNTYMVDGLPPAPIANPSASSIEAALNPAETNYVFYVQDGGGGYAFAETFEEHNENVARWRRFEAERNRENSD